MFRYRPEPAIPIPEAELFGGINYYEIYTANKFQGERLWPDELWEEACDNPELMSAMTEASIKWMGNRCLKNTFKNLQAVLDENAVDYICILPIRPANSFEDYKVASQLDERILPFTCIYQELNVEEAIEKLLNDVQEGARGLKIHPIIQDLDLRSDYVRNILQAWATTGLPVISHCGHVEYGIENQGSPDLAHPEYLAELAQEMPEINFVGAHCGGCLSWEADYFAKRVGKRANVWVDTSFRGPDDIRWMVEAFGEDKVLFGVDIPFSDMDVSLACVQDSNLGERVIEKILWHNAAELLEID